LLSLQALDSQRAGLWYWIGGVAVIVCTLSLRLSESDRRKVIASLSPLIGSTRTQVGCRACDLLIDAEDPRRLVLWQEWDSQDQLARHLGSGDYRLVLAAMEMSQEAPQMHFDTVAARGGLEVVEAARKPPTR
jgi:quinol monooxygenase YgiN